MFPSLAKLLVAISALPKTVRLSFAPQVKSLAASLLLKSPPTLRLRVLVVIVPLPRYQQHNQNHQPQKEKLYLHVSTPPVISKYQLLETEINLQISALIFPSVLL